MSNFYDPRLELRASENAAKAFGNPGGITSKDHERYAKNIKSLVDMLETSGILAGMRGNPYVAGSLGLLGKGLERAAAKHEEKAKELKAKERAEKKEKERKEKEKEFQREVRDYARERGDRDVREHNSRDSRDSPRDISREARAIC